VVVVVVVVVVVAVVVIVVVAVVVVLDYYCKRLFLFRKNKRSLMRSPCCLSVSVHLSAYPPLIFWAYEIILLSVCIFPSAIFVRRLMISPCCLCVHPNIWFSMGVGESGRGLI
jgi:hypothetical protein